MDNNNNNQNNPLATYLAPHWDRTQTHFNPGGWVDVSGAFLHATREEAEAFSLAVLDGMEM